jgi:hypothetical protein
MARMTFQWVRSEIDYMDGGESSLEAYRSGTSVDVADRLCRRGQKPHDDESFFCLVMVRNAM